MSEECRLRRLSAEDAECVAFLEAACFSDAWSEDSVLEELKSRLSLYLGVQKGEQLVGYISTRLVLDEGEIFRVAVLPECRRLGLGDIMMKELMEQTPDILMWNLEVRESNLPARRLYEKHGFAFIGLRKNYYHDPVENGIMMQWNR